VWGCRRKERIRYGRDEHMMIIPRTSFNPSQLKLSCRFDNLLSSFETRQEVDELPLKLDVLEDLVSSVKSAPVTFTRKETMQHQSSHQLQGTDIL